MSEIPMIKVLTVKQACDMLAAHGFTVSPLKLRLGLEQKIYPFGDCVQMKQGEYDIYEHLLKKWILERAEPTLDSNIAN